MSMNWREIALALSELPLQDSLLQKSYQIAFNGLLLEFFNRDQGRWNLYIEVGTPQSRLHRVTDTFEQIRTRRSATLQRFIQFMRSQVENSRVVSVEQLNNDRVVLLTLRRYDRLIYLYLRLFSGAAGNVIVLNEERQILELLFRRPKRKEMPGEHFTFPPPRAQEISDDGSFPVRERQEEIPFNRQLELAYQEEQTQPESDQQEVLRQKQLMNVSKNIARLSERLKRLQGYDSYRQTADLLSSYRHTITPHSQWVELIDYHHDSTQVTIELNPKLDVAQNIDKYYQSYRKAKTAFERAESELTELKRLEAELLAGRTVDLPQQRKQREGIKEQVGLRFQSGPFTLLVGRNARENDHLLRHQVRGNDWWVHLRDAAGAYVFIKSIAKKSVPLETLLDAANLALLYSKAKESGKGELYYTQVKYLRRAKGAKRGTVIPTQEKNLSVILEQERIQRLFLTIQ